MAQGRLLTALPRTLESSLAALASLSVLVVLVSFGVWDLDRLVPPDLVTPATGTLGAGACFVTAFRRQGRLRSSWAMFGLSIALVTVGDVLAYLNGVSAGDLPAIGAYDLLFMGALLPAALGIIGYPVLTGGRQTWRLLVVDGLVLVAAVVCLVHLFLLRHVLALDLDLASTFGLVVYPLMTALLATLVALLLLRSEGHLRLDLALGGTSLVLYSVAGSAFALSGLPGADPDLVALGTSAFAVTQIVAAGAAIAANLLPTPRRTLRRHLPGVVLPLLPDLAALSALGLAIVVTAQDTGTIVLGTVTLLAVGTRQISQTASGERLRGELEHVVAERTHELAELTEAYRRLDAMKLEFVTAVSHELRTPLAAIRGSLEMLHEGDAGELPRPALTMIAIAGRGSERLTRLVDDIIDLDRLESGTFGFDPQVQDVAALVGNATRSLDGLVSGTTVRVEVDTHRGGVWCDADRVTQVLVNLVGNALKFAPEGSTITVASEEVGDAVRFSVSDQGPGIPAEHLETVFDRFHQAEMDASRQRGGAGLGLTICRHIVHRHGGRIWAENTGQGARILFTLPCAGAASGDGPQVTGDGPQVTGDGAGASYSAVA